MWVRHLVFGIMIPILVLAACRSEPGESETLTVSAQITLKVPADTAVLNFELEATGDTREAAMAKVVAEHNLIKSDLKKLEGLQSLVFEAEEVVIREVPSANCLKDLFSNMPDYMDFEDLYDYGDICPESDFLAYIDMYIWVQPAELTGQILGYSTQSEASQVRLDDFEISDMQKARNKAKAQAAGQIREVAQNVADETGVTLGRITRLSFQGDSHFSHEDNTWDDDEIVVMGSRIMPPSERVTLDVDPELIEIRERVVATFEISE